MPAEIDALGLEDPKCPCAPPLCNGDEMPSDRPVASR